jgi:Ca2+-binding EF-hand superfamily protein
MDADGSKSITLPEFKKGLRNFKFEQISDQDIGTLFNSFDANRNGSIDYKEFIGAIRVSDIFTIGKHE